ncbi:MAG: helix-turn-helix transcriptional regulator, partial [Treponema sp.]|nr:helix-turn-helix transcriptional regulator [Treponema sp.]
MEEKSNGTLQKILSVAEKEFLDKGFRGASLREIVKSAGVT